MMKHLVLALLFAAGISAYADHHKQGGNAALGNDMKAIAESYGKLGQQIDDKTKNMESAKIAQEMIDKSMSAAKQTPPNPKMAAKFKTDMQMMVDHLQKMKTALAANNNAEAKTHWEALKPWTTPDHAKKY